MVFDFPISKAFYPHKQSSVKTNTIQQFNLTLLLTVKLLQIIIFPKYTLELRCMVPTYGSDVWLHHRPYIGALMYGWWGTLRWTLTWMFFRLPMRWRIGTFIWYRQFQLIPSVSFETGSNQFCKLCIFQIRCYLCLCSVVFRIIYIFRRWIILKKSHYNSRDNK